MPAAQRLREGNQTQSDLGLTQGQMSNGPNHTTQKIKKEYKNRLKPIKQKWLCKNGEYNSTKEWLKIDSPGLLQSHVYIVVIWALFRFNAHIFSIFCLNEISKGIWIWKVTYQASAPLLSFSKGGAIFLSDWS